MRTKTITSVMVLALVLLISLVSAEGQKTIKDYNSDVVVGLDGSVTQTIYSYPIYLDKFVSLTQDGDDLLMSWDGKQIKIKLNVLEKGKTEQSITDFKKSKKDVNYSIIINWTGAEYKFSWKIKDYTKKLLSIDSFSVVLEDVNANITKGKIGDEFKEKTVIKNNGLKYFLDDGIILDLSDLVATNYSLSKNSDSKVSITSKDYVDSDEIFLDPTISANITKASYINGGSTSRDDNFGTSTEMHLSTSTTIPQRAMVEFDVSSLPGDSIITSAVMNIKTSTSASAYPVNVYAINSAWTETEVTWNNKTTSVAWNTAGLDNTTDYNSTIVSITTMTGSGWYAWDVTNAIQWWVNGLTNNGLLLLPTTGSPLSTRTLISDDSLTIADRPYYQITYNRPSPTFNLNRPTNNSVNTTSRTIDFQGNASWLGICDNCNITRFNISYSTSLSAFDANIVNSSQWSINFNNYSNNWTTTLPSDNFYYWRIQVDVNYTDATTGNSINSTIYKFLVDITKPAISITSPSNNTNTTNTGLDVNYTVSDALLGSCWWNNGTTNTTIVCGTNITTPTWSEGLHTVTVYANDSANNLNSSSVTFRIDTTAPALTLVTPVNLQEFNTNNSIAINFTASDSGVGLGSCVYSLDGGANVSIASCANTTINVSDSTHTLKLCANDTLGNTNCTSTISFSISLTAPAITLNSPIDGTYWKNGTNFYLNYTATDGNGISVCQIWNNFNGTFKLNQTNTGLTSGVMNFSIYNITSDGIYLWNIWCNDTLNNGRFSTENHTFIIDMILPNVSINAPITTTVGSQNIQFIDVSTDTNLLSCKYSIYNSSGSIDGLYQNITKTCNSVSTATVSGYATFTVRSYALDLAGNENYAEENVTTTASSPGEPGGGGGAGDEVEKIPVVGVQGINSTKVLNYLELEIVYARINDYCAEKKEAITLAIKDYSEECSLTLNDLEVIQLRLSQQGVSVGQEDLIAYFKQYTKQFFFQGYETSENVEKYKLFTSVLGITNPMTINPPSLDKFFLISSKGAPKNVSYSFSVNKNLKECTVTAGEGLSCEVTSNTTFKVIQYINDTKFLNKIFTGAVTITSKTSEKNLEVRAVPVTMRVYNMQGDILGIPAYIFVGGAVLLLFIFAFVIFGNKKWRKKLEGKN